MHKNQSHCYWPIDCLWQLLQNKLNKGYWVPISWLGVRRVRGTAMTIAAVHVFLYNPWTTGMSVSYFFGIIFQHLCLFLTLYNCFTVFVEKCCDNVTWYIINGFCYLHAACYQSYLFMNTATTASCSLLFLVLPSKLKSVYFYFLYLFHCFQ